VRLILAARRGARIRGVIKGNRKIQILVARKMPEVFNDQVAKDRNV
jgi:hypothetical protein